MDKNFEAVIGNKNGEHIGVKRVSAIDAEKWFHVEIEVQCDGWRGKIGASFMQGELTRFATEIRSLHENLTGEALLDPMEQNLILTFLGDGKGHVLIRGKAQNRLGSGTELSFQMDIDQTYLLGIADALCQVDSYHQANS